MKPWSHWNEFEKACAEPALWLPTVFAMLGHAPAKWTHTSRPGQRAKAHCTAWGQDEANTSATGTSTFTKCASTSSTEPTSRGCSCTGRPNSSPPLRGSARTSVDSRQWYPPAMQHRSDARYPGAVHFLPVRCLVKHLCKACFGTILRMFHVEYYNRQSTL